MRIAVIPSELEGATSTFQRISELTGETIPKGFEHAMVGEVVSLSDYNAARALLGMEPVSLADGQYLLLCNMDQVEPFVNGGLEKGFSVTVGDVTLTPARAR